MAKSQAGKHGLRQVSMAKGERPSIREAQKLLTRERLIDAAYELFGEVGYSAATVDQIMKRAGANRATFYLHFKDKREVAFSIGERSAPEYAQQYRELDKLVNPSVGDVRGWVERYVVRMQEHRALNLMMNDAVTAEAKFAEQYLAYLGRIADVCMANTVGGKSGKQRDIVRSKIVLLILMLHRFAMHVMSQGIELPGNAAVDAIAGIIHGALFADSADAAGVAPALVPIKSRSRPASVPAKPRRLGAA